MAETLRTTPQPRFVTPLVLLAVVTALSIWIVQRLFMHPLAKHRGPFFARLSSWPNWYHATRGDRHVWILRLHAKYGSAVRFSPNSMSFNTLSAVETIYSSRDICIGKGDWYQCVKDSAGGFESTFTARDRTRHAQKRRILAHAFSERALRDYEPRIKVLINRWLDHLADETRDKNGSVDFAAWSNYLIFDILGDLCFGKDFGLMHSSEDRHVTKLLPSTTRGWYMLGYHPWTHLLRYLLYKTSLKTTLGRYFTRNNSEFREFCVASLMERVKRESMITKELSDSRDMFHHLLNARDPDTGEGFSKGDLGAESVLLMIAGTHTTSVAIAAIVFYLAKEPGKLAKAAAEIQSACVSMENPSYKDLTTLPYLRACINESLRLCPPTAGHLQREVLGKAVDIDGFFYPKGTNLGVAAYAIQRNPDIWSDPDDFLPERWVTDDGSSTKRSQPGLVAFSSGPLGCPGRQLAYMEMTFIIFMLVKRYDLILDNADGSNRHYTVKDCYVGQGTGPQVLLRSRCA